MTRVKMREDKAYDLLAKYGVPVPEHCLAQTLDELEECSERVPYPHVLKIVSPDVIHKSDVGGVVVGVENLEEDKKAFQGILENVEKAVPGARIDGILVQHMVPKGVEVIVGGLRDKIFDVVVMFGLGGIFVEVLKDVSFRVAPMTPRDAFEMLGEIRGSKLLEGVRGIPPRDKAALAVLIYNVYRLLEENIHIVEVDLNPVMSYEQGAAVADARIIVEQTD